MADYVPQEGDFVQGRHHNSREWYPSIGNLRKQIQGGRIVDTDDGNVADLADYEELRLDERPAPRSGWNLTHAIPRPITTVDPTCTAEEILKEILTQGGAWGESSDLAGPFMIRVGNDCFVSLSPKQMAYCITLMGGNLEEPF